VVIDEAGYTDDDGAAQRQRHRVATLQDCHINSLKDLSFLGVNIDVRNHDEFVERPTRRSHHDRARLPEWPFALHVIHQVKS
jgi:hypothetical protein